VDAPNGERDPSSPSSDLGGAGTDMPDLDRLLGSWTHSHEEDSPGEMVFRRGDRPFPPSRGRVSLAIEPDGAVVVGGPGADDRRSTASGRWVLDGTHLSVNAPGWSGDFEVVQAEGDRLVLRRR
jgi:hypothetical protein